MNWIRHTPHHGTHYSSESDTTTRRRHRRARGGHTGARGAGGSLSRGGAQPGAADSLGRGAPAELAHTPAARRCHRVARWSPAEVATAEDGVADGRPCTRAARRAEPSAAARVGREAEAGARSELLLNELEGLEPSLDGPPELEAVAPAPSALAVPSELDHLRHARPISVQAARWASAARRTHPRSTDGAPSLPWPRAELGRATRGTPAASGRSVAARRGATPQLPRSPPSGPAG